MDELIMDTENIITSNKRLNILIIQHFFKCIKEYNFNVILR